LFVGSEGTLGIITEAWMRLQNRPRWQVTASVAFDDWTAAVTATRTIRAGRALPGELRLLDPAEAVHERRHAGSGWAAGAGVRIG